jgi:diacylglycerol kinase (ATP)
MRRRPLFQSFNYAIDGLIFVLRTQRNMRIHFALAGMVLALSLAVGVTGIEFILLLFAISMVVTAELMNTAIEAVIDVTTTSFDPMAKIAKDVAAAAVLVTALTSAIIAYVIFYPKLSNFSTATIERIRYAPMHLTAISLLLVIILVIAAKAWTRTGTWLRGGWPSGHAALAGSLLMSIALISRSPLLTTLAFILAVLVFQSRMEAKFHTLAQVLAGSLIGILTTLLLFQLFLPQE